MNGFINSFNSHRGWYYTIKNCRGDIQSHYHPRGHLIDRLHYPASRHSKYDSSIVMSYRFIFRTVH